MRLHITFLLFIAVTLTSSSIVGCATSSQEEEQAASGSRLSDGDQTGSEEGAPERITVSGDVAGRTGDPKAFARISFDGPGSYTVVADGQGRYRVNDVQPGNYVVTVRHDGNYQDFRPRIVSEKLDLTVLW